jgi:hypothetical protein
VEGPEQNGEGKIPAKEEVAEDMVADSHDMSNVLCHPSTTSTGSQQSASAVILEQDEAVVTKPQNCYHALFVQLSHLLIALGASDDILAAFPSDLP